MPPKKSKDAKGTKGKGKRSAKRVEDSEDESV